MIYTNHARERMIERNITPPIVLGVLINSRPVDQGDGTRRHSLNGFNIVTVDNMDGEEVVVTVFEDRFSRKRKTA